MSPQPSLESPPRSHSANNYNPLPVTLTSGEGAWVTDTEGRRYLDALAGYSALNFGHGHPALVAAVEAQLHRLTLTSRAFQNDHFERFCERLSGLTGKEAALVMNTGAEAVETAIKLARRWGTQVKGVGADRAKIIVMDGNFHGRTTTIVSFATDPTAREGFGPFTPGFEVVAYGDAAALEAAIDDDTVAVLLEPVQGEAGVIGPPSGYLEAVREISSRREILFIADEIQSGLGRTGTTFACEIHGVIPDVYILGKALGGGILPVSAVLADWDLMGVFTPGSHGSTFGGNPLASAVGIAVIDLLESGEFQSRSRELGAQLEAGLRAIDHEAIVDIRVIGLWAGVEVRPGVSARAVCERMMELGVLVKDTQETTLRLAPPLVIEPSEVDLLVDRLATAIADTAIR
jgi:ornithine--oxo-acid transaminase